MTLDSICGEKVGTILGEFRSPGCHEDKSPSNRWSKSFYVTSQVATLARRYSASDAVDSWYQMST